jgi:hypothetical protein
LQELAQFRRAEGGERGGVERLDLAEEEAAVAVG